MGSHVKSFENDLGADVLVIFWGDEILKRCEERTDEQISAQ